MSEHGISTNGRNSRHNAIKMIYDENFRIPCNLMYCLHFGASSAGLSLGVFVTFRSLNMLCLCLCLSLTLSSFYRCSLHSAPGISISPYLSRNHHVPTRLFSSSPDSICTPIPSDWHRTSIPKKFLPSTSLAGDEHQSSLSFGGRACCPCRFPFASLDSFMRSITQLIAPGHCHLFQPLENGNRSFPSRVLFSHLSH